MVAPAVIFGAVSLASSIAQMFGASSSAKKLDKINARNVQLQAEMAVKNFSQQANANTLRYAQEKESAYQQQQQVYLDNLRKFIIIS